MKSALLAQQLIAQLAFLAPERLLILLIIPALILAYIFASLRKNRRGMRFTNTSMLDVVVPKQSQWRCHRFWCPQPPLITRWKTRSTASSCRNRRRSARELPPHFGLYSRLRRTRTNPNSIAPGAIVLLSNGANTTGRAPMQAATEARAAKVSIYTIAYGTENGYVDLDGKREPVPVDHEEMKRIAAATNREYFAAATADQLRTVYENIGSDVGYEKAHREVTARFSGYGLALAVLAALGAISLGAKMAVMFGETQLLPGVVGNGIESGRIGLALDHFSAKRRRG